jgi:predicted flap endonuclease-1-like 5' DNA nuclease
MLDGIVVPIFQVAYTFLHFIAMILWGLNQAMLLVGYYLMALTDWLINSAFAPLLTQVINQTGGLLAPIFTIAMLVLAITYLLSVFGHIQIVEMRSAIMWLIFAAFVFQTGPSLYAGTEQFRRGIGGMFYESGFNTLSGESSNIDGLTSIGTTPDVAMGVPTNNFWQWLPFDQSIDGLDVALAYLYADGCDVLKASGCMDFGPLPARWYLQPPTNVAYFDNVRSGDFFRMMDNDERQESLANAGDGIWRLFSGLTVSFFGMVEQLIHLTLAIAMGIAYLSLMIAVLFAFFKRTESVTWSVFNLIIELFIQSIVTSLMLSIVMTFVIIGAGTGNGILLLGSSFIGGILLLLLFLGAVKAIWNALNRLIGAMGQASGGNMMTFTGAAGMTMGGAAQVVSGGVGAAALMQRNGLNTDTAGQMAGMMFAGSRRMTQGAMYARQAFGEDSALGGFAENMFQGATAAQLTGRAAAGFLLPGQDDEDESAQNRRPRRNRTIYDEDGFPMPTPRSSQPTPGSVGTSPRIDNSDDDSVTVPVTGANRPNRRNGRGSRPTNTDNDDSPFGDLLDGEITEQLGNLIQGSRIPDGVQTATPDTSISPTSGAAISSQDTNNNNDFARSGDTITGNQANTGAALSSQDIARLDASDDDDFAQLGDTISGATQAQRLAANTEPPARDYSNTDIPPDYDDGIDAGDMYYDLPTPTSAQPSRSVSQPTDNLAEIPGIGAPRAQRLNAQDIHTFDDLAQADSRELSANIPGISPRMAQSWINNAQERTGYDEPPADDTLSPHPPDTPTSAPMVGATPPSAAQIASAVDESDNDDDARLSTDMRSAISTGSLPQSAPETSASPPTTLLPDATDSDEAQPATIGSGIQSESPASSNADTDVSTKAQEMTQTPNTQPIPVTRPSPQPETTPPVKDTPATIPSIPQSPDTLPSSPTASEPETTPSASQIAASVDAANNDDNARLVAGVRTAGDSGAEPQTTAPADMSSLGSSIAQAVRSALAHGANPPAAAYASHIAQQSGIPAANAPEVGQFARMANQMQLTPEQTSSVVQDVAQTGSIGPELANSIRSSLSGLASSSGQDINMDAAISGLQQAATAMTTAVQSTSDGQAQSSSSTPAKSGGQTASGGDANFGKPPVSDGG